MGTDPEIQKFIDSGRDLVNNGQAGQAVELYAQAAEAASGLGQRNWEGYFWQQRGVAHGTAGKTDAAMEDFSRAEKIFKELSDDFNLGCLYRDMGITQTGAKDYKKAKGHLEESIKHLKKTDDKNSLGVSMAKLGVAYLREGKNRKLARKWLMDGLETIRTQGDWFMEVTALLSLAELGFAEKEYPEMISDLWAGIGLIYDKGDQEGQKRRLAEIYGLLAQGYKATGAEDRSKELLDKAEVYLAEMPEEVADKVRQQIGLELE